ncbi:MAG: hypothetical protein IB616_05480 [Methanosarcinales archaeon]|nr:MAG: hypothetical protein IB616_05480 [Methanosarcinales archaeon]
MSDLLQIYERLEGITLDEFKEKVQEKIKSMGGLCDEKTAAMLVAHDLGMDVAPKAPAVKIGEISLDAKNVSFVGKVVDAYEPREFAREDGSLGRVANILVSDETGSIRVALWDDLADLVKVDELKVGQVVNINGYVKEGYTGIEINIGRGGSLEFVEGGDVTIKTHKINEIAAGMNGINVVGKVLDVGEMRTFARDDGTEGYVCSLTIGDETGKTRTVLWGDDAKNVKFTPGDVVEIKNGYSKEGYGGVEIHIGARSSIKKSDEKVEYSERFMKIGDIGINEACDVKGVITEIEDKREFTRSDGSPGKVANIRIADETGGIRVVLWGEHADLVDNMRIGTKLKVTDGYAKAGWGGEVELNTSQRSTIVMEEKNDTKPGDQQD